MYCFRNASAKEVVSTVAVIAASSKKDKEEEDDDMFVVTDEPLDLQQQEVRDSTFTGGGY